METTHQSFRNIEASLLSIASEDRASPGARRHTACVPVFDVASWLHCFSSRLHWHTYTTCAGSAIIINGIVGGPMYCSSHGDAHLPQFAQEWRTRYDYVRISHFSMGFFVPILCRDWFVRQRPTDRPTRISASVKQKRKLLVWSAIAIGALCTENASSLVSSCPQICPIFSAHITNIVLRLHQCWPNFFLPNVPIFIKHFIRVYLNYSPQTNRRRTPFCVEKCTVQKRFVETTIAATLQRGARDRSM